MARAKLLKTLALVLLAWCLLFTSGVVAWLVVSLKPRLREHVLREAARRGVELSAGDIEYDFNPRALALTGLTLHDVELRPLGVAAITAKVKSLRVTLQELKPSTLAAEQTSLGISGSVTDLQQGLTAWSARYLAPAAGPVPSISATDLLVAWRQTGVRFAPTVTLRAGALAHAAGRTTISAEQVELAGYQLKNLRATLAGDQASLAVLGPALGTERVQPELTAELDAAGAQLTFGLAPISLQGLLAALGPAASLSSAGNEAVRVSGQGRVALRLSGEPRLRGDYSVTLTGYVPPHPPELDGFVFGDKTELRGSFNSREFPPVEVSLTDTTLKAGAFVLAGQGKLLPHADHAQILLKLRGDLACAELASAAAKSRLGQTFGRVVALGAKRALTGSVAVLVAIDATTRALDQAQVKRSIGVGCGLRPLDLSLFEELSDGILDLPGKLPIDLAALPFTLPKFPSDTELFPDGFPALPKVPKSEPAPPASAN